MKRLLVVAIAGAAMATTGCSGKSPSDGEESADHFAFVMSYAFDEAERVGAGPEQMAILEEAQRAGALSFDLYNEAVDNALRCLRERGYEPHDGGIHYERGFPERAYSVPVEAEAADPVDFGGGATVHRCVAEHSLTVEGLHQNQPSSVEAQDAHFRGLFEPHRAAIVECAVQEGIEVDPDGDILELVDATKVALHEGQTDVDCTEGIW